MRRATETCRNLSCSDFLLKFVNSYCLDNKVLYIYTQREGQRESDKNALKLQKEFFE